jgi:aminoglycoside phosphotransferase (APT) family kinase protein
VPLPDFPPITDHVLRAIASRHGLSTSSIVRLPQVGLFNTIYLLGDDTILRIPRDHPRFVAAARNEAIAVPLARAAGVRTPELLAFDDELDLLPVPYSLYERVPGVILEHAVDDPAGATSVWHELGRDLAKLHAGVARQPPATILIEHEQKTDPRPLPDIIAGAGYFTAVEARWLTAWLDRLAPHALAARPHCFVHDDMQSANVMVQPETLSYLALIDWGSCRWGDPTLDFAAMPLRAVPALLEGYRQVTPFDDESVEARVLWRHLQIGLHQLRGKPQPETSWGERPMTILFDVLRFFTETRDERWQRWAP